MFNIYTATCHSKSTVKTVGSFDEALDYANNVLRAEFLEIDEDHAGCADFYAQGAVFGIEPVGFKAAA